MALLEKLDDLCGKATEIVQTGVDKATEMMQSGVAIAKLKADNMAEEDAMRRAFLSIGKIYFELYGDNPDPAMAVECDRIRSCKRQIAENDLRLAEIKNTCPPEPPVPQHPSAEEPTPCETPDAPSPSPAPAQPDTVPEEKEEIPMD